MKKQSKNISLLTCLNTGIFPGTICFSVGFKYDELYKDLKKWSSEWCAAIAEDKEFIEGGSCFALRRTVQNEETGKKIHCHYIIFTDYFDFSDHDMCKLAHECLHIIQFIMPDFLNPEVEIEAVAYTHTHIMKQCLDKLRGAIKP